MTAMLLLYSGALGSRVAERYLADAPGQAASVDDRPAAEAAIEAIGADGQALVLLSDVGTQKVVPWAELLRRQGVRWTSAYAAPTLIRIGPLVGAEGICFRCGTQRYLSAPGAAGLARFERFVQSGAAGDSTAFEGYPETVVEMLLAEALRQVSDPGVPTGFIRKVNLLDFEVSDAVATPVHGCECGGARGDPTARFHLRLRSDFAHLFAGAHP